MAEQSEATPLNFATERGASRSRWVAGLLLLAVVGWMASGFIIPSEDTTETAEAPSEARLTSVAVVPLEAQTVTQYFVAEGQALPDRVTSLRAEATGQIAEVFVDQGDTIGHGQLIARSHPTRNDAPVPPAHPDFAPAANDF